MTFSVLRVYYSMNKMYLVLGDWSDDGHGKYEKILLLSNKPVSEVQQAYKDSCRLTGLSFNGNKHYTGLNRTWHEAEEHEICTDYEDYELNETCKRILKEYGIEIDEDFICMDSFVQLWIKFVKLSLPDLELERSEVRDEIPNINGYWNQNLNVQFGYGLFT